MDLLPGLDIFSVHGGGYYVMEPMKMYNTTRGRRIFQKRNPKNPEFRLSTPVIEDEELTVKPNIMVCKNDGPVPFRCSSQSDMEYTMWGLDVMLLETKQKKVQTSARGKIYYTNL